MSLKPHFLLCFCRKLLEKSGQNEATIDLEKKNSEGDEEESKVDSENLPSNENEPTKQLNILPETMSENNLENR